MSSLQLDVLTFWFFISLKPSTQRAGNSDSVAALEELTKQSDECLARRTHRMHRNGSYLSSGG